MEDRAVLIVEDRKILAESLAAALERVGMRPRVVMEQSLSAVEDAVEIDDPPDVALVALGFAQGRSTELTIGALTDRGIPTLVMTGGNDRMRLARCVTEGAVGIIDKNSSFAAVAAMVADAARVGTCLNPEQVHELRGELRRYRAQVREQRRPFERLTRREREVLLGLTQGKRAEQIADDSFVALSTVRSQIRSILTKLGVSSQLAAVAMANRANWYGDHDWEERRAVV